MKEVKGNLWDFHNRGRTSWIVITNNGNRKGNGEAVMGAGLALQAKKKFPQLPMWLGNRIKDFGNQVYFFGGIDINIVTFPTKENWWESSSVDIIRRSCRELVAHADTNKKGITEIFLPRVGCLHGRLHWEIVKPILEEELDDRFTVVSEGCEWKTPVVKGSNC